MQSYKATSSAEAWSHIVSYVHSLDDSRFSLLALVQVNRSLYQLASDILYRHIEIQWISRRALALLRTLQKDQFKQVIRLSVTYPTFQDVFPPSVWAERCEWVAARLWKQHSSDRHDEEARKAFNDKLKHDLFFTRLIHAQFLRDASKKGDSLWLQRFDTLDHPDLPRRRGAIAFFDHLLARLPNLRQLKLDRFDWAETGLDPPRVPVMPELRRLTISQSTCNQDRESPLKSILPYFVEKASKLEEIRLDECYAYGPRPVISDPTCGGRPKQLHTLKLTYIFEGATLPSIFKLARKSLSHVYIRNVRPEDEAPLASLLGELEGLETLWIHGQYTNDASLAAIEAKLKSGTSGSIRLDTSKPAKITGNHTMHRALRKFLISCTTLRRLTLLDTEHLGLFSPYVHHLELSFRTSSVGTSRVLKGFLRHHATVGKGKGSWALRSISFVPCPSSPNFVEADDLIAVRALNALGVDIVYGGEFMKWVNCSGGWFDGIAAQAGLLGKAAQDATRSSEKKLPKMPRKVYSGGRVYYHFE